jgi:hypothetical protein
MKTCRDCMHCDIRESEDEDRCLRIGGYCDIETSKDYEDVFESLCGSTRKLFQPKYSKFQRIINKIKSWKPKK